MPIVRPKQTEKRLAAGAIGLACLVQGGLARAATIAVDSTAPTTSTSEDDGQCSLAEAIQAANLDTAVDTCPAGLGRDVISLPEGTYEFLLPYTAADTTVALPVVTSEISIQGPANGTATLTFNAVTTTLRFLTVAGNGKLTLEGLTFSQAHGPNEVFNQAELTVSGCTFQGNGNASAPAGHACVLNGPGATLSVLGSRFVSNQGAAIVQDPNGAASLSIENTEFIANFYTAVRVFRTGTVLNVTGSLFDQNSGQPGALDVAGGASATITDTRFTDNTSTNTFAGALQADAGNLTIVRSTFSGNKGHTGGAIGASSMTNVSVSETTFAGNEASSQGGALSLFGGTGTATIRNSTFSGNSTPDLGGAIWADLSMNVVLNNVTITGNTCREGCGLFLLQGDQAGTFTLSNTIIAANGSRDCYTQGGKFLISAGHNLFGRNDACTVTEGAGDQLGTPAEPLDAGLGPLDDNGGPTLTHALLWNSAALDAGSPATTGAGACEASDQVGTARPVGPACDIGAFEGSLAPPATGEGGAAGAMDEGSGGMATSTGDTSTGDTSTGGTGGSIAEGGASVTSTTGEPGEGGAPPTDETSTSSASGGAGGSETVDGGVMHPAKTKQDSGCGCRLGSSENSAGSFALLGFLTLIARRRRTYR